MMKKLIFVLLAAFLLISVFAFSACGEEKPQVCETHVYVDGVCSVCGEECEHNFVDSKCTVCGFECIEHSSNYVLMGKCGICGALAPEAMVEPLLSDEEMAELHIFEVYEKDDIKIGCCLSPWMLEEPYASMFLSQFNSVTLENGLKPQGTLSQEESINQGKIVVKFSDSTVKMLDWCKENKLAVRGHTFVWYQGTPEWIFYEDFDESKSFVSREEMLIRLEDYIKGVFETLTEKGYADMFYAYDIVNEAITNENTVRSNNWFRIIGEDYIWQAFNLARKYAPDNIALYYNDFDMEIKCDKVIELIKSLVDEDGNSLVDGIGHQLHRAGYTVEETVEALRKLHNQTGLTVEITELDISVGDDNVLNFKEQGRYCYNLMNEIVKMKEEGIDIDLVSWWGFYDARSWTANTHPALYDKDLIAKYAYFGMMQMKEYSGFDE